MTNEYVKQQLLKYQECLDNKVLNDTNYDSLVELLKEDIQKLKKQENQNTYTKISIQDNEKILIEDRNNFTAIANLLFKVFFDYYMENIKEPIEDEIFDLMTLLFRFFLNRSMIYNQLTNLNLRPVTINCWQNHDDKYYHPIYQELLAKEEIYDISEICHDELFRQYCNGLCKMLIKNNKFDYLIDFYNKANRIIEQKVLVDYFIELKSEIDYRCYNYKLCDFLSQLFDRLDFSFCECYTVEEVDNFIKKHEKTGLSGDHIYGQIMAEVQEFFGEFIQDKVLFDGFDKYINRLYDSSKKRKLSNKDLYKCAVLKFYINLLRTHKENASLIITKTGVNILKTEISPLFSISFFDYMEEIIDYFIYLRDKEHVKDMDKKIYRSLNLYVRTKNISNQIITSKDKDIIEFKEKVEKRLDKLQDTVFTINKYLVDNLTDADKEDLVKKFFKSAFHKYTNCKGIITEAKLEYEIIDLSKKDIDLCYEAIKNNKSLIDQIVTGEKLIEPFARAYNMNYDYASGDYTNLVVCQIKAIERYIKEVLVQHHEDKIYKTVYDKDENKKFAYYENGWKKSVAKNRIKLKGKNPTAESLNELECGYAINALLMAYKKEGILEEFKVSCKFYGKCIDEVRNGHFHIDKIETVNEALMRRSQTAFWLMHLITKLGEKGILMR